MRLLSKVFDKFRPLFEPEGKLSRIRPAFQMADNMFFATLAKAENAPFGRDPMDVKRYMSLAIMGLIPAFLASIYFYGWRILLMVAVSYIAGAVAEIAFAVFRKEEVNEGFLVTGLIFPLTLPPGIPLWTVALGVIFGVVVGKEIFGGTGRNLFNPALVGRVFLALGYPSLMTSSWIEPLSGGWGRILSPIQIAGVDSVSTATPLVAAKSAELADTIRLLLGNTTGSAGETSAVAILLGGLFLLVVGVASWRTILAVIVSFVALNAIVLFAAPETVNPVLFNLLSGGFLFGTFFMATDPVSSPVTRSGKWTYGILIGAVTMLIRSFSGFVEGMMFAILFGNICAPLIDEVVIRFKMRRYAGAK